MIQQLIRKTIQDKNVSQQMICQGICDEAQLSRYLAGKRGMDRLTFNALLQRLGLSSELFITLQSNEEYQYFQKKMQLLQALNQMDWKLATKYRQDLENMQGTSNQNQVLQQQILFIIDAILFQEVERNTEQAIFSLKSAIDLTHSDLMSHTKMSLNFMSNLEWCALLNWIYLIKEKEYCIAVRMLQNIVYRLENNPLVEAEQVKIYPYVVYLLAICYIKEERYEACEECCEKAILLLRKNGRLYYLPELMECDILCKKKLFKKDQAKKEEQQLDALKYVIQNYKRNNKWLLVPIMENGQEIQLYGIVIAQKRKQSNISQKELSKDICSINTLRAIEKDGKSTPSKWIIQKLLQKLGVSSANIVCDIKTTDVTTFYHLSKLRRRISCGNFKEAMYCLEEFAYNFDQSNLINRQWIQFYKIVIEYAYKKWNNEEYIKHVQDILRESNPHFHVQSILDYCLTNVEVLLIVQLAQGYADGENYKYAIEILQNLLQYYKTQNIMVEYLHKKISLIEYNQACFYNFEKNYTKVIELALDVISLEICNNSAWYLPSILTEKAYAQMKIGNSLEAKQLYDVAAIMRELFYQKVLNVKRKDDWL